MSSVAAWFVAISCGIIAIAAWDGAQQLIQISSSLARIADNADAMKTHSQQPPAINAECHETLSLFDEILKKDLRQDGRKW